MSTPFNDWAVLELLGHRIRYGKVSEVTMFGEAFCKIEIPGEPPAVEFYSGKALYGIRPASEESIRAYHAPRKLLVTGPEPSDEDRDEEDDGPQCAFCAEPLGDEPTERVETGPDGEVEIWHERCAKEHAHEMDDLPSAASSVDTDQPRGDL